MFEIGVKPVQCWDPKLVGIRGWLTLQAIELVCDLCLFILISVSAFVTFYQDVFLNPFGSLISFSIYPILERLVAVGITFYLLLAVIRFFKMKKSAPSTIISLRITRVLAFGFLIMVDVIITEDISDEYILVYLVGKIIEAAIWIPYFKISKRVKATFVR